METNLNTSGKVELPPKKRRERKTKAQKLGSANLALSYVIQQLAPLDDGQKLCILDAVKIYFRLDKLGDAEYGE